MKITKRQLRKIIKEAIDVVNAETGELLIFDDQSEVDASGGNIKSDAPEAAEIGCDKGYKISASVIPKLS